MVAHLSSLLLFLLAATGLLPGQVLVLDVLDGVVESDQLLLLALLLELFVALLPLPLQLLLLFLLVALFEPLQVLVRPLSLLLQLSNLRFETLLALFRLVGEILRPLLDIRNLARKITLKLLTHQILSPHRRLDVLDLAEKRLLALVEYPRLV